MSIGKCNGISPGVQMMVNLIQTADTFSSSNNAASKYLSATMLHLALFSADSAREQSINTIII
jgi:hypothetical protein